jgi:hypothetical protein
MGLQYRFKATFYQHSHNDIRVFVYVLRIFDHVFLLIAADASRGFRFSFALSSEICLCCLYNYVVGTSLVYGCVERTSTEFGVLQ